MGFATTGLGDSEKNHSKKKNLGGFPEVFFLGGGSRILISVFFNVAINVWDYFSIAFHFSATDV